jgi:deazaflavin-dependent oxidoreductase (nitroreductase family)
MSSPIFTWWRLLIHKNVTKPMMTRFFSSIVVRVDRPCLMLTRGKFSPTGFITGWPIVNITTTGAKTAQPRTTPLVGIPDGQKIVLIASNFGKSQYPAWYYNLKKKPVATIHHKGMTTDYRAMEVSGIEWQKYWQMALETYPGYRDYSERAGRSIPIMILEPIENNQ